MLATGWSLDHVLRLDILTFNAFMAHVTKLTYADRADKLKTDAMVVNAGMSGKTKALDKLADSWRGLTADDKEEAAKRTGRDGHGFMRDFGLLKGGRI